MHTRLYAATLTTLALALPATANAATLDGRAITAHPPLTTERGHIILLHGFTGDHTYFNTATPANSLLYQLRRQGYRVVTPDLPYHGPDQGAKIRARLTRDNDGGASYARMWRRAFHRIVRWTNRRYGHAPTIVGGISWGGFHAMQAACTEPHIAGWFAISPVVEVARLNEFAGFDTRGLSLDPCAHRLATMPGRMSYGDADTRVGVLPQQHLATLLANSSSVRVRRYPGLDHTTTPAAIARVLRFTRKAR